MTLPTPLFLALPIAGALPIPTPFPGFAAYYADPAELLGPGAHVEVREEAQIEARVDLGGAARSMLFMADIGLPGGTLVPGLKAELTYAGVHDVALIDLLDDRFCGQLPPTQPPGGGPHYPFLGAGRLMMKSNARLDDGQQIVAVLETNRLAPGGVGGEALFTNVYVALVSSTVGFVRVTPILDGELLEDEETLLVIDSDGSKVTRRVYEIGLATGTASRQGVRGTWFGLLLRAEDLAGCGRLTIEGVEVEHETVSEGVDARPFTAEAVQLPVRSRPEHWFLGAAGLAEGGVGTDDLGVAIRFVARTNPLAPAGVGGEAIFTNLYLATVRSTAAALTLRLTPELDGVDQESVDVVLAGVASATEEVTEIGLAVAWPSLADPQVLSSMRGTWFAVRVETVGALPAGRIMVSGLEVEHETVTEGTEASNG